MAEVAIPIIALGIMYLISNNKNEEGYQNSLEDVSRKTLYEGTTTEGIPLTYQENYPKDKIYNKRNVKDRYYKKTYDTDSVETKKYINQNKFKDGIEKQVTFANPNQKLNDRQFQSLTGKTINKEDFKSNNMVPFFGSKLKQRGAGDYNDNEVILDNHIGSGKLDMNKKEQAPLFAPKENMHHLYGTPNNSDFIQSRISKSRYISSEKPFEEIRVAPGLNKGYTHEGSQGFNSGMTYRKKWIDKTVDDLRVKTNPKLSFGLANHEGPAISAIKERGMEGKIEKNRPDTFYVNNPDRWFTTTGIHKAQRVISEEPMQAENRTFTTREYFGNADSQNKQTQDKNIGEGYRRSTRPELPSDATHPAPAHNVTNGNSLNEDYGKVGYKSYTNSRSTTQHNNNMGIVGGIMKAAMAPVVDILRPSRKENVIGNLRPNGNVSGAHGVNNPTIWNPTDRPRTTIKEQTEDVKAIGQPFHKHEGGYNTNPQQSIENQRDTTNVSYVGNSSAGPWVQKSQTYNSAYNAELNPYKELLLKNTMNVGCKPTFNNEMNVNIKSHGSINSAAGPISMPKEPANMTTFGEISGRNTREVMVDTNRNTQDLLQAFNNNPYTQSLQSIA